MSEIRATTISDLAGTGPATLTKQSAAKAWSNIDGTGTTSVLKGFNVTSVTDNGTGQYTSNFTSAFSDANYVATGTNSQAGGGAESCVSIDGVTTSTASYRVTNTATQAYLDKDRVYTLYHGDLA